MSAVYSGTQARSKDPAGITLHLRLRVRRGLEHPSARLRPQNRYPSWPVWLPCLGAGHAGRLVAQIGDACPPLPALAAVKPTGQELLVMDRLGRGTACTSPPPPKAYKKPGSPDCRKSQPPRTRTGWEQSPRCPLWQCPAVGAAVETTSPRPTSSHLQLLDHIWPLIESTQIHSP